MKIGKLLKNGMGPHSIMDKNIMEHESGNIMELNNEAAADMLTCGHMLSEYTLNNEEKSRYPITMAELKIEKNISPKYVQKRYINAVDKASKGKKNIGIFFSGGYDSRLILVVLLSLGYDVTAITFGTKENREYEISNRVAKSVNVPQVFLEINADVYSEENAEGLAKVYDGKLDALNGIRYYHYRKELKEFDVIFCGESANEVMRTQDLRWYNMVAGKISGDVASHFTKKRIYLSSIVKEPYLSNVEKRFEDICRNKSFEEIMYYMKVKYVYKPKERLLGKLFNFNLPGIDDEVVSAIYSLPFHQRSGTFLTKYILKRLNKDLYKLPVTMSIFPLYFPWWIHYGYRRIFPYKHSAGRGKLPSFIRIGLHESIKQLPDMNLDVIDRKKIISIINDFKVNDSYTSIARLLTILFWIRKNEQ
jgi:hypothetical protein